MAPLSTDTTAATETRQHWLRRHGGILLVALVGTVTSLSTAWHDRHRAHALFVKQIELRVSEEAGRVQRSLDRVADEADSLRGLFAASQTVSRSDFGEFVRTGPLRRQAEMIQAVEWLPRVSAAERAAFEAETAHDLPGFRITEPDAEGRPVEAATRDEYFPITYLEPMAGNERVLGLDAAFRPVNRRAMERARDSGEAVSTGRVNILQGGGRVHALMVYRPIYRPDGPVANVEQRRENLLGFVVALVLPERLMGGATAGTLSSGFDVFLLDPAAGAAGAAGEVLHASPSPLRGGAEGPLTLREARQGVHRTARVHLPGRELEVLVAASPAMYEQPGLQRPWLIAIGGLLLTILLVTDLLRRTRHGEETAAMAAELGKANAVLSERGRRLAEAQQLAAIGSWELDLRAGRLDWSEQVFRILEIDPDRFGASYEAFLEAVHPDDRETVDRAYRDSVRNRTPYRVEHRVRTADGRIKLVEERGETFYDARGEPVRSVGTLQDLTGQRAVESRMRVMDCAIASSINAIAMSDMEGRLTYVNGAFLRLWGRERADELLGRSVIDFWESPEAASGVVGQLAETGSWSGELVARGGDGSRFEVQCSASLVTDEHGRPLCMMASFLDITERKRAEEKLRQAATVFANTREGVVITDAKGSILDVNAAFTSILGYSREEAIGQNPRLWKSSRHDAKFYQEMWAAINQAGHWQGEIWNRSKDGGVVPVWLNVDAVRDDRGELTHYVAVFSDISGIKRSQAQLAYLAQHDPLTDLPNRLLFGDRLGHALARAEREGGQLALLFLDLDHFKHINDSLGHPTGDALLQEVARRLCATLRKQDTVARMGGDEFTVLVEELRHEGDAALLAEKVLEALARPFSIHGREFYVTGSVGISVYPRDGNTAEALVANADAAMYRSKESGRNAFNFYTRELTDAAMDRVQIETDLRRALDGGELFVHYQPQVDLASGRLIGAEALARWSHPQKGFIPPDRFIPVAEASGLIIPLGEQVLRMACRQANAWLDAGMGLDAMAVNVAGPQLQRSDFAATVRTILHETGLPPGRLELEVTETFIMREAEASIGVLNQLRALGVKLSIDDFGTGYSSLAYLKRLPIDKLKIDRSFVHNLPGDDEDAAIARAVIVLARSLGKEVIAEGVETEAQRDFLLRAGCDQAQGYLFGRPVAAADFLLRKAA